MGGAGYDISGSSSATATSGAKIGPVYYGSNQFGSQGLSTTSIIVIVGAALAALFFFFKR